VSEAGQDHEPADAATSGENRVPARRSYAGLPDAEVVDLAQRGHEDAAEHLLDRYRSLVWSRVESYFLRGVDRDDLLQVGMSGLWQAIVEYQPAETTSFPAFARGCIDRHILTAIQALPR
jgi:RNA polymerase sporulation-specific sigma factor